MHFFLTHKNEFYLLIIVVQISDNNVSLLFKVRFKVSIQGVRFLSINRYSIYNRRISSKTTKYLVLKINREVDEDNVKCMITHFRE